MKALPPDFLPRFFQGPFLTWLRVLAAEVGDRGCAMLCCADTTLLLFFGTGWGRGGCVVVVVVVVGGWLMGGWGGEG